MIKHIHINTTIDFKSDRKDHLLQQQSYNGLKAKKKPHPLFNCLTVYPEKKNLSVLFNLYI